MRAVFIYFLDCATVALALESANIVGYASVSDEGNNNPGIGSVFMPIDGSDTYTLSSITVKGATDEDFMIPGNEYLQKLDPNGSAVIARYTYVSEAFLKDEFEDEWENYKGAIGWWLWNKNIASFIEDGDYSTMCNNTTIEVGTAFLGKLSGNELQFVSSGSVALESTSFNDNGNSNPFFLNYLPVEIDINDITVTGATEEDFMVPGNEYLQVLDPNGSAVTDRYTYVSEAFLKDEFEDEWENYKAAIGWWNWNKNIASFIEDGDYSTKLGKTPIAPGFSFLGKLAGNELDFNFPAATK